MLFIFLVVCILFLLNSRNLLLTLLLLEILSFFILFFSAYSLSAAFMSDFLLLAFFSIFVIEGVVALSGLITLVTFTGSDYVRSSSLLKF